MIINPFMNLAYLENSWLRLELLSPSHLVSLWEVVQHIDVFAFSPNDLSSKDKLESYIQHAIAEHQKEEAIPFAIYDKKNKVYVGSTRFGYIDHKNRLLHIGWTWIAPKSQGTGLNTSLKQLMISEAFGPMNMRKIVFRVDALNTRSRKAVEKLGATLEGILKKDVYVKGGRLRDTCCYALFREGFFKNK